MKNYPFRFAVPTEILPEDVLLHDPLPVEGHLADRAAEVLDVAVLQRFEVSLNRNKKVTIMNF